MSPACRIGRARRRSAGARRARRLRRRLSARIVRRHEDAGVAGARAGHRSRYPPDGRAVRGARRDHALPPQQRPARAVAQLGQDRRLRHPFGVRVRLSVAARGRDDAAARAASAPTSASRRRSRAARSSGPRPPMANIAARSRRRWRRPIQGRPRYEHAAKWASSHSASRRAARFRILRIVLPVIVAAAGTRALGGRGAASTTSRLMCCRRRSAVFATLISDWDVLSQSLRDDAADHAGRLCRRQHRRHRAGAAVQPVETGWNIRCFPMR